jgi:threonine/homoserine/homoserine lactone efflux protein
MLISFLGSIPPGHLTIAATYITAQQGVEAGFIFSLGAMLAEVIVVRIALSAMNWIASRYKFFLLLEIITVLLLTVMTIGCFYLAIRVNNTIAETRLHNIRNLFSAGFLISVINPIHFPFWIGWSVVLMNRNILLPKQMNYNWYVTGIGIGSMLGYALFIYGGEFLLNTFNKNQNIILFLFGVTLLIATSLHIRKMLQTSASVRYSTIFKKRN